MVAVSFFAHSGLAIAANCQTQVFATAIHSGRCWGYLGIDEMSHGRIKTMDLLDRKWTGNYVSFT